MSDGIVDDSNRLYYEANRRDGESDADFWVRLRCETYANDLARAAGINWIRDAERFERFFSEAVDILRKYDVSVRADCASEIAGQR